PTEDRNVKTTPQTQEATKTTRIMLVDDHPIVREGLAESINRENDLHVCAQAEDHLEALKAIEVSKPDLVVIDLMLKSSSGLELIKDVHARWPRVLLLVVSMHDETLYAERVLRAGAQGYITKQEAPRDILLAIRRILAGGIYLNERTSSAVLARLGSKPSGPGGGISEVLADRELQVFELTGMGLSTREIAAQLHIDMKTVDTYRARIREKLNLKTSSELLQLAIRWNKSR
ncbi:MAG TPA: response regulator transcription factor, partial [Verrucomicrobiae bacterium]|nr:response regulator transcription factor [Verrucomicrobiae bacterium]